MSKNLVEKGKLESPLMVYNRTTRRANDLEHELGDHRVSAARTIGEALAQSDIIFTCLSDDRAVTNMIAMAVKGDVKGKLFVDCSTVHPDTTTKIAKKIESHGGHFVACPGKE